MPGILTSRNMPRLAPPPGVAVTNAVRHATGKRVRDLPITPDKLF